MVAQAQDKKQLQIRQSADQLQIRQSGTCQHAHRRVGLPRVCSLDDVRKTIDMSRGLALAHLHLHQRWLDRLPQFRAVSRKENVLDQLYDRSSNSVSDDVDAGLARFFFLLFFWGPGRLATTRRRFATSLPTLRAGPRCEPLLGCWHGDF